MHSDVKGIIPPLPTPFDADQELDLVAFNREIEDMSALPVRGFVIGGSTGEGHALSVDELATLCREAVRQVGGRLPIVAGIITTSTRDALVRARAAKEAGADGVMVVPAAYQITSDDGLVEYYTRIYDEVGLPIIIYNVLHRVPVSPAVTRTLAKHPGIIATKESTGGNLNTLSELIDTVDHSSFSVTWAQDPLMFPGYALGAAGSISAINAIMPRHSIAMFDAVQRGDLETARRIHYSLASLTRAVSLNNWPGLTKAAINLQGRAVGPARSPFVEPTAEQREAIEHGIEVALSAELPVLTAS